MRFLRSLRFPSLGEIFWAVLSIFWLHNALNTANANGTVKAIYFLCLVISLATVFLLKAIREK